MKKLVASILVLAMTIAFAPINLIAAARQTNIGQIAGKAVVEGKPLPNIQVRLRNVDNGQLAGTTTSNANGEFNFGNLPAGNYVVETIAPDFATVLGTSARITLVAGAMAATGITVATSAAAAAAAGLTGAGAGAAGAGAGAAGAGAAAGGAGALAGGAAAGGAFFGSALGIGTLVGAGLLTTGLVVANTGS